MNDLLDPALSFLWILTWLATVLTTPRMVAHKGYGFWQQVLTLVITLFFAPFGLLHALGLEDKRMAALEEATEAHHRWAISKIKQEH